MEEDVTRELVLSVPENELRQRVCERFAESERYAFAWLSSYDPAEERVPPTAAAGTAADALEGKSLEGGPPRQRVVRAAVETRNVRVERGLLDDPPSADWGDHARDHGYQSVAVVPLVHEDEVYGVLYLAADRADAFDADEQCMLATLGETIACALDDAEAATNDGTDADGDEADEVEQRERHLRDAYEIIADGDLSFSEQVDGLLGVVREAVGTDFATFSRVTDNYRFEAIDAPDDADLQAGETVPLEELPNCRRVVESEETLVVRDIDEDAPELADPTWGISCYLGTPVYAGDEVYGTFCFYGMEARSEEFTDWDVTFVELLGDWVGSELERRNQVEKLRESEQHLSTLVETTPECIKTVAADGTLLQMNPAGLDMVEADAASSVVGECVYDLIAPEHRQKFREFNERVCEGESGTLEFDIVGLEGTRRHMESHAAPMHNPDGTTVQVALTRDVTERKQRQRKIEESEQRYRTLAENFPNGAVGVYDDDLRYTLAQGSLLGDALPGRDQIEGRTISEVYPQDIVEDIGPLLRAAVEDGETGSTRFEFGGRNWRVWATPLRDDDGDIFAGLSFAQDVTEQVERERYLSDAKAQLEAAAEAGAVGTWEWHIPDDRFVAGASFARKFGIDPEAARDGVPLGQLVSSIHEADRERVEAKIEDAVESCGEYEEEYRVWNADDELRWVVARGHVECDDDGNPVTFPGALTDITERKQRQQELHKHAQIVETVDDGIYALDADSQFTMVNDAYCELTGYDREELLGAHVSLVHSDETDAQIATEMQRVRADGREIEPVEVEVDTADGGTVLAEARVTPFEFEDGTHGRVGVIRDVTERKEREHELEQYETVAETASDVIVSIDAESRVQYANPTVESVFGYEPGEVIGEPLTMLMPDSLSGRHRDAIQRYLRTGERTLDWEYLELPGKHRDGHEIPLALSFSEYEHDGDQFFVGIIRDNTERKRFERALTNLHQVSRDLTQTETKLDVSRHVVDAARDVLDLDNIAVYLFGDTENALHPTATTERFDDVFGGEPPTFTPKDTAIAWDSFINDETISFDDILESDDVYRRDTPLRSGIWIPLSDHGVLAILSEDVGEFDQQTQRLADHLAATAEATLDRVGREESLREQERELELRNQQLENLNRTNDIIRDIDQALVEATTREAVEQAVCGLLTRDGRFTFAWIGNAGDEAVTPRRWAGDDQGYLDAVSLATGPEGDGDPAVETAATGDTALVSNVGADLRNAPWRKAALARDLQSVVSIPLQHDGIEYGVLTVYDTEPDAFDDLSQSVLRELGETIANAMNFIDTRRALLSDSVVELELDIHDADDPLVQLARETGCRFEFEEIVPQTTGTARVFVTATGATADTVRAAAAESARVEDVTLLSGEGDEDDGNRLEISVAGATIPSTLVECGAVVRTIQIADTETNVVVELPHSVGVRTFVDRLEGSYPDTELVARRDRERPDRSQDAFETALTESLTHRQLETLQTAYHSGYFEWPRDRTGEEVASDLDITQPTFNGHLRAAERKLCAMLFEGESSAPD